MLTRPPVAARAQRHPVPPTLAAALVCLIPTLATATAPLPQLMQAGVQLLPDNARTGILFGTSVGIDGDIAAVGASFDAVGGNANQGAVFVYERSGSAWPLKVRLTTTGNSGDYLGGFTEVHGNQIFGSAYNAIDPVSHIPTGLVYVFTRDSATGTWSQTQALAPNPPVQSSFGFRTAVDGDTLLVNSLDTNLHALVYVFARSGNTWSQVASLAPNEGGSFGSHISLSGDTAVVGANAATNGSGAVTGAAYVFVRSGGSWTQQARLLAADGAGADSFGFSVSVSGDDIAVGAFGDDIGNNINQGSVHLYHRSGTVWTEGTPLLAPDGGAGDSFGKDVRLCGSRLYVGASSHANGSYSQQGAVYRWDKVGGIWGYVESFTLPPPGRSTAYFGDHLGVSGNNLIVGAPFADQAYVYAGVCAGDPIYRSGFE